MGKSRGNMKNATSQITPVEKGTYVSRKVRNPEILYNFFKDQGVNVIPMNELHCTIAYSKKEFLLDVDHNEITIKPEQLKSKLEPLGNEGAVVLKFESDEMTERFNHCIEKGATYDYPKYIPHISISYDGKDLDLNKIKIPNFDIILYDEKSEELNLEWKAKVLTESANYRIILKPLDKLLTELDIIIGEINYRLSRKVFDNLSRLNLLYNKYLTCMLDISKLLKSYSNNYKFEANNLIMKYFDMNFKNLSESSKDLANKFKNIIDKLNSSQDANSSLNFNQLNFEIKDNLLFNIVKNKKGKIKMENSEVLNINEIFMESLFDDEIQQEIMMEAEDYDITDPALQNNPRFDYFKSHVQSLRDALDENGNIKPVARQKLDQIDIKQVNYRLKILLGTSKNVGVGIVAYIIALKVAKNIGLPVGTAFNVIQNMKVFYSILNPSNLYSYNKNKKYAMIIGFCYIITLWNAASAGINLVQYIIKNSRLNADKAKFTKELEGEPLTESSLDKLTNDYVHKIQTTSDQSSLRRLGSSIMNDNILSVRHKRILTGEIAKKLGTPRLESEGNIAQNSDTKKVTIIQSILKSIGLGNKNADEVISYIYNDMYRYHTAINDLNISMKFNGAVGVFNIGAATLAYITACKLAKNAGLPVGSYRNVLTNFKVFLSINPFKSENPIMVKIWIGAMLSVLNALVGGKNIQIAISAYLTKKKLMAEYQTESLSFTKQLEAIDLMESYSPRRAVLSMRMFDDLIKRKGISSKTKSSFSELVNYVQDRNEFKQDSSLSQTIRKEYGESFDDYKSRYNRLFSKV